MIVRAKVHESGIEALEDLLSHDADLLVIQSEDEGLVTPEAYAALVALLNNLKSPFVWRFTPEEAQMLSDFADEYGRELDDETDDVLKSALMKIAGNRG